MAFRRWRSGSSPSSDSVSATSAAKRPPLPEPVIIPVEKGAGGFNAAIEKLSRTIAEVTPQSAAARIISPQKKRVVLDMSSKDDIEIPEIRALLKCRPADEGGCELVMTGCNSRIISTFKAMGLTAMIPIVEHPHAQIPDSHAQSV